MTTQSSNRPTPTTRTVKCTSYSGNHKMNMIQKISKLLCLLALGFSLNLSASPLSFLSSTADNLTGATGEPTNVILKLDDAGDLNHVLGLLNGLVVDEIPGTNIYLVSLPSLPLSLNLDLGILEVNGSFALPVEVEIGLLEKPEGTAALWYAEQAALKVIKAPEARSLSTGLGIVVADIDARFDHEHPALESRFVNGYDFVDGNPTGNGALYQSSASYMFEDDSTALNQSSASYMFEDESAALNQSSASYMFQSSASYMFEDELFQSSASYMFQSSASYMFEDTILDQSSASYMFGDNRLTFIADSLVKILTPAGAGLNHGTFTAGVIAATAPDAQIMPLRAFDDEGQTSHFTLAKAIYYAVDNGADVINMSWGTDADSDAIRGAIEYADSKGVTLIASAGNMNSDVAYYPAAYEQVIAVAATDNLDKKAEFSSYGNHVFISAPGVNIISTYPGGGYGMKSGTSFSAPMVAGQAALMRSMQLEKIKERVSGSSVGIDDKNPEYNDQLGEGRVDVLKSLGEDAIVEEPKEPEQTTTRRSRWFSALFSLFGGRS